MSKKINLELILFNEIGKLRIAFPEENYYSEDDVKNSKEFTYFINAMKEACRQTLELAAENAECEDGAIIDLGFEIIAASVNKQSILDTINQIE